MLSLQEIALKYEKQLRETRKQMNSDASFHPEQIFTLKEYREITETTRAISWSRLNEFLGKGQTLGDYFVAVKVYDDMVTYSLDSDIVPLISAQIVNGWEGGDLTVPIPSRTGYVAEEFASGAVLPTSTVETMKATLSPITFGVAPQITEDLIEDSQFGLMEWHLKHAAQAIGEKASNLAMTVLGTASDGWGTLNSGNASADETTWAQIETAIEANTDDRWHTDTIIINPEAWEHSVKNSMGVEVAQARYWQPYAGVANLLSTTQPAPGFDFKIGTIDVKKYICDYNHAANSTDATAMTKCKTLLFNRKNALFTGRKKWMQLTNYADPIQDLSGLVVKCRQGSISLYDDCIFTLSET
jgi:hypothetical protein